MRDRGKLSPAPARALAAPFLMYIAPSHLSLAHFDFMETFMVIVIVVVLQKLLLLLLLLLLVLLLVLVVLKLLMFVPLPRESDIQ